MTVWRGAVSYVCGFWQVHYSCPVSHTVGALYLPLWKWTKYSKILFSPSTKVIFLNMVNKLFFYSQRWLGQLFHYLYENAFTCTVTYWTFFMQERSGPICVVTQGLNIPNIHSSELYSGVIQWLAISKHGKDRLEHCAHMNRQRGCLDTVIIK